MRLRSLGIPALISLLALAGAAQCGVSAVSTGSGHSARLTALMRHTDAGGDVASASALVDQLGITIAQETVITALAPAAGKHVTVGPAVRHQRAAVTRASDRQRLLATTVLQL